MILKNIRILPRGAEGWRSEVLEFGREVTQLYGPNGCGKTPIIQAIVFCLGYPCKFREDIYQHCDRATLVFEIKNSVYSASRAFTSQFDIELSGPDGEKQDFYNEKEYSEFLFELLNLSFPNLVTNSSAVTTPYLSSILPIFYLGQDDGYSDFYSPQSSFVKDQFSEMIRILFDIRPKNSFDLKKDALDAKRQLDNLDAQVLERKRSLELASESSGITDESIVIDDELIRLRFSLDDLRRSSSNKSASITALDEIVENQWRKVRNAQAEISELGKHLHSMRQIIEEIDNEINTLNLNEDAKRVFQSFEEICAAPGCGMFSVSSESYGKSLLYLKDQIKDLERNTFVDKTRKEELERQLSAEINLGKELQSKRDDLIGQEEAHSHVTAVNEITSKIVELEIVKRDQIKAEKLQTLYFDSLMKRDGALDRYNSLSSSGSINPELTGVRVKLANEFSKWMMTLDTSNVSNDIKFKDDFVPILGNESLSQLSGSTKLRLVLAYHAAIMRVLLDFKKDKLRFLIFDTPKQHEMHDVDLANYIDTLKKMAHDFKIQIIFSATEYHHQFDFEDREWTPTFPGVKQKMFLG